MMLRALLLLSAVSMAIPAWPEESTKADAKQQAFEAALVMGTATADGVSTKYALYVPPDYAPSTSWPLIVFLHGVGERGEDGLQQTRVGIGPAIRSNPERFPCLVLMPQCLPTHFWPSGRSEVEVQDAVSRLGRPSNTDVSAGQIRDALDQVKAKYNVDPDRIALTGLSMGGFGTFQFGAENVDEFSCLMPICGGGDPSLAEVLAQRPIRVFHGSIDPVVSPQRSIEMVEAIRAAGGTVSYTEFAGVSHDAWIPAYADPDNIAWLLAQKRP